MDGQIQLWLGIAASKLGLLILWVPKDATGLISRCSGCWGRLKNFCWRPKTNFCPPWLSHRWPLWHPLWHPMPPIKRRPQQQQLLQPAQQLLLQLLHQLQPAWQLPQPWPHCRSRSHLYRWRQWHCQPRRSQWQLHQPHWEDTNSMSWP